jgi:hypothetical protein
MQVRWILRDWLRTKHGLTRPTDISRVIFERTGYKLSPQAISELLKHQPKMLRLDTIQALCSALDCRLSDFCEVLPRASGQRLGGGGFGVASPASTTIREARRTEPGTIKPEELPLHEGRMVFAATLYPNARLFSSDPIRNNTNLLG